MATKRRGAELAGARGAAVWTFAMVGACATPGPGGAPVPAPADVFGGTNCKAVSRPTEPALTGWSSADRAELAVLRRQGVVAVRYVARGCNVELELLANCIGRGTYAYTPAPSRDSELYKNARELFADLPLGAAKLSAKLQGNRVLRTDFRIAGVASLPVGQRFSAGDLSGPDCGRATHVVASLTLGAFAMAAGDANEIGAAVSLFGADVGARRRASLEKLSQDGEPQSCDAAIEQRREDLNCAVPLRISLLELGAAADTNDPRRGAPSDAPVETKCAQGKHFELGHGCVANPATPNLPGSGRGPTLVSIPAATLHMGSADGAEDEKPVHDVVVAAFQIDATEVTAGQFADCVRAGACSDEWVSSCGASGNYGREERANHPMNCVSWKEAHAFCEWARERLPKEEEWELAARGTEGRRYPWGDERPDDSRLRWGSKSTAPVGSYRQGKSPLGLYDLAGNVWEWTATRFCGYGAARCDDSGFVVRGGDWEHAEPEWVSATNRARRDPSERNEFVGFRCAR